MHACCHIYPAPLRACTAQPVEADTDEYIQQAELIDGKAIAQTIRKEVAAEVVKLREKYGKVLLGAQSEMITCLRSFFLTCCVLLTEPRTGSGAGREQKGLGDLRAQQKEGL